MAPAMTSGNLEKFGALSTPLEITLTWLPFQTWLRRCDESHRNHYHKTGAGQGATDYAGRSWLINMHQNCIVAAERHGAYYALSYVWGVTPSTSLTTTICRPCSARMHWPRKILCCRRRLEMPCFSSTNSRGAFCGWTDCVFHRTTLWSRSGSSTPWP